MRIGLLLLLGFLSLLPTREAAAGQADAREVARMNNCVPKKIEVYSQTLGPDSQTVYRIECNMPKMNEASSASTADALLVECNGTLCTLLRPLSGDAKK